MINFRFHLVSLVAVFLALGVGVAMGASFVDRATVDSLRSRVDDLGEGYQRRGDEIGALEDQLAVVDGAMEALAGEDSLALFERLADEPVVLITTDGVPGDVLDATRTSLDASGAATSGILRLQPAVDLADDGVLSRVRERLGLRSQSAAQVRTRVVNDLGTALALLGPDAEPVGESPGGPTTTTTAPGGSAGAVRTPTDVASARRYLDTLTELGLIAIDTGGVAEGGAFPDVTGVRYAMVVSDGATVDAGTVMLPLARSIARGAPAALTVAETRNSRPDGQATTTTVDQPERGSVVADLRDGDLSGELSTVDDLDEAAGRIALVYAVAEQVDGRVGHYGVGPDTSAPFPTVPAG